MPNRMKYTKTPERQRTWVLPGEGVEEKGRRKREPGKSVLGLGLSGSWHSSRHINSD